MRGNMAHATLPRISALDGHPRAGFRRRASSQNTRKAKYRFGSRLKSLMSVRRSTISESECR